MHWSQRLRAYEVDAQVSIYIAPDEPDEASIEFELRLRQLLHTRLDMLITEFIEQDYHREQL